MSQTVSANLSCGPEQTGAGEHLGGLGAGEHLGKSLGEDSHKLMGMLQQLNGGQTSGGHQQVALTQPAPDQPHLGSFPGGDVPMSNPEALVQHYAQMAGGTAGASAANAIHAGGMGGAPLGEFSSTQSATVPGAFGAEQFGSSQQLTNLPGAHFQSSSSFADLPGPYGTAQFTNQQQSAQFANPLGGPSAQYMSDYSSASIPGPNGTAQFQSLEQSSFIPGQGGGTFSSLAQLSGLQSQLQASFTPGGSDGSVATAVQAAPSVFQTGTDSVSDGRYTLTGSTNESTATVYDNNTGTSFKVYGDPHIQNSAGDMAGFQKEPLVATLGDGSQLVFTPGATNAQGVSTLQQVQWVDDGQTATLSGLSGSTSGVQVSTDPTAAALPSNAVFLTTGQQGLSQLYIGGSNAPQANQLTDTTGEQNLDPYASGTPTS